MAKTLQEFLTAYHKQSLFKKPWIDTAHKKLAVINQYERIFEVKTEMDSIMLDVYYQSTLSKNTIQTAIEAARNAVFDIWPNLDNNQKNHLLQVELSEVFASLPQFVVNDTVIVVAFFDELLNALLVKRTAVFDLPQFFKLYKAYKESTISPTTYHSLPFETGFSECTPLLIKEKTMVLFHPSLRIVFEIHDFVIIKRFPFALESEISLDSLKQLAKYMVDNDIDAIKQWIQHENVLSKSAKKASQRKGFLKIVNLV